MSGNQHKFRIGDPVWAKMKGFSPWPGKVYETRCNISIQIFYQVCMPPSDIKRPAIKKQMHCVNFFGTNDFAWIEENNMKDYEQYKV